MLTRRSMVAGTVAATALSAVVPIGPAAALEK